VIQANEIDKLLSPYKSKVLSFAEMALPESQFRAFRKNFLDAFGQSGFYGDLERYISGASHSPERQELGRNKLRKKGGVP